MSESIIDQHSDLLELLEEDGQVSQRLVSSRVLGREAAGYLQLSDTLRNRILAVLEQNINAQYRSAIAIDWAVKLDKPIDYTLSLLESFLAGIKDRL